MIDIDELLAGVEAGLRIKKAEDGLFSIPSGALFPISENQSKWKYAKGNNFLKLSNGTNVFLFHFPDGEHEEEFKIKRKPDPSLHEFEQNAVSTGLAQVHRSDPGSIYFTLQEGKKNPTYTFKHTGADDWTAIPKKKKKPFNLNPQSVKSGIKDEIQKVGGLDSFLGTSAGKGANSLQHLLMYPGRDWQNNSGISMGLLGAGLGGMYHLGKKYLYNTQEENESEKEEGYRPLLKRMLFPALGLGLTSAVQGSLFPNFYKHIDAGNPSLHNIVPFEHNK